MPTRRVAMDVIEEVLRMRHECGRSQREIARACALSVAAVNQLLQRATVAGLGWPLPPDLDAEGLRERLYGRPSGGRRDARREALDFAAMHKQLSRRKSLTLQQLWREYREAHADGYGYSQYCELYWEWKARRSPVMLQEHKAGEKLFVAYAGQTVPIHDAARGASFRGGAGGEFVLLRGSELGARRGELDRVARARLGIFRGLPGGVGPGLCARAHNPGPTPPGRRAGSPSRACRAPSGPSPGWCGARSRRHAAARSAVRPRGRFAPRRSARTRARRVAAGPAWSARGGELRRCIACWFRPCRPRGGGRRKDGDRPAARPPCKLRRRRCRGAGCASSACGEAVVRFF